jgi:hypothetical protein
MLPVVIKHAATSALRDAGFDFPDDKDARAAKLRRALKLMDVEDVEIDDDGEVLGLEDAIDELKAEFPELFAKASGTRQRKRPGNTGQRQAGHAEEERHRAAGRGAVRQ